MIFPPFLDLRRNPALAYDYIINRKVNGKMTGRLQIGNVRRALTLFFQDREGKDFGRVMVKVLP
jgi:hypothetical protein